MGTRMLQRRGTAAEWASANPVLGDGEVGVERDTGVIKIGDGTTAWTTLTNVYRRFVDAVSKAGDTMTGGLTILMAAGNQPYLKLSGTDSGKSMSLRAGGVDGIDFVNNAYSARVASLSDNGRFDAGSFFENGQRVYSPNNPQPATNPFAVVDAAGDLVVGSADNAVVRLAKGGDGTVLTVVAGVVGWAAPSPATGLVVSVTGNYAIIAGVGVVLASGTNTTTLPSAASSANRQINIKNTGTGVITVATAGGNIDGVASVILNSQYASITVVSDGTNWFII